LEAQRIPWNTGCWGAWDGVKEFWTDGRGQMFGVNRTVRNGRAVRWGVLRIHEGGTNLIHAAAPSYQPPAEIEAAVATADSAVLRNPAHDSLTGLTYRRAAGDSIVAAGSGPDDDGAPRRLDIPFGRVSRDGQLH